MTRKLSEDIAWGDSKPHPLLQRIYAARGVDSIANLQYELKNILPYDGLLGIDAAVTCLYESLAKQERVLIVGDYDADGATSTALAVRALTAFGFENVDYIIPDRFEYGYGLTPEIVKVAIAKKPQLLITVDNGIASIDGVAAANAAGIKVLVTDHHLAGQELPAAVAIVNPNQPDDTFAGKNLAGVGVIFYVMLALRGFLRQQGWFAKQQISEPNMAQFLDLVALGTVADVVTLDYNNRILIEQGLRRIRADKCCAGIKALLQTANRKCARIIASDLGFIIGPRLNAAGRLENMAVGVECLLTDDANKALTISKQLNELNNTRRLIEADMRKQAMDAINNLHLGGELPTGLCLYDAKWHQGVVGILAARIKDKFHRPVIAFAKANNNEIKGSARSITGLHIRDVLENIAIQNPGLITKFGGHAMAAGLSLELAKYKDFTALFDEEVSKHLTAEDLAGYIYTDGELQPEEMLLEIAELLRNAGPWGQGFPEPLFVDKFNIIEQRLVGQKHLRLALQRSSDTKIINAIAFNVDLSVWPNYRCENIEAVYKLDVNEYQGVRSLQLVIAHIA